MLSIEPHSRPVETISPASVILHELHEKAPADHVTLAWVTGNISKQSFGLLMLMLAVLAAAPGISLFAGLLLLILAIEMAAGCPAPTFPRWIATRQLPARQVDAIVQRAIPVLKHIESVIHPRWPTPTEATKRVVGITVVLLTARLLLNPIPLSNIIPAVLIALIALAYLEEDGLLLAVCLLVGWGVIVLNIWSVLELINGVERIGF